MALKKQIYTLYQNTLSHGKNYDAKNMMHTFRLLNMAEEIVVHKQVMVHRHDREFLLSICKGEYEYDDLQKAEALLVQIRESFYAASV